MSKKLQNMIDAVAFNGRLYHIALHKLMDHCIDTYGFEPGDVDADDIIDQLLGGDGLPSSMPAKEFDEIMRSYM